MYARAVDEAAGRLRDLRRKEWEDFGFAALAVGLALAATQVLPELALPFFLAGVAGWALGVRALVRRFELVDDLASERDAYVIPEIVEHAAREATFERRRTFAALIGRNLVAADARAAPRVAAAAEELRALVAELGDRRLDLDPASAVACMRLLSDPEESPLLNPALPPEDLGSRIRQIRSGFTPRRVVSAGAHRP